MEADIRRLQQDDDQTSVTLHLLPPLSFSRSVSCGYTSISCRLKTNVLHLLVHISELSVMSISIM